MSNLGSFTICADVENTNNEWFTFCRDAIEFISDTEARFNLRDASDCSDKFNGGAIEFLGLSNDEIVHIGEFASGYGITRLEYGIIIDMN